MQALIRASAPERFPEVERFRTRTDWNSPEWVARELLAIAFDPARAGAATVVRLPVEGA